MCRFLKIWRAHFVVRVLYPSLCFSVQGGNLEEALGRIKAKVFVMPINEDIFFPVRDCEAEQKLIPNSELKVINSICGHFGLFGGEGADYHNQIDSYLNELLAINVVEPV